MNFQDILQSYAKYGSAPADLARLAFGLEPEQIHEKVILAPVWSPEIFEKQGVAVTLLSDDGAGYRVYDLKTARQTLTYVVTGVGSPNLMDAVLALGATPCQEIVFLGAVGALSAELAIGDLVVPDCSICGDGACRYLTMGNVADNDCFGERYFPDESLKNQLLQEIRNLSALTEIRFSKVQNFSIDTIAAQFLHIDEILALGAKTVEMETASLFKAAQIAQLKAVALFVVSDNTVAGKSLLSGRTSADLAHYRQKVRQEILPQIVLNLLN